MTRSEYEKTAKKIFRGKERKFVLKQIENFYELQDKSLKNRKYRVGDDVILEPGIYMTGFKENVEYLTLISKEGKISGDYAGVPTRGGVKYAVSLWKFNKQLTLKDYIVSYSGITAVWGKDNYEFVPYGKLDEFANKMKEKNVFCWFSETTRECRFLPSLARDTEQIALIFNMKHKECEAIMQNDLIRSTTPKKLNLNSNNRDPHNKEMNMLEDVFTSHVAYPVFGIPRNCIEGLFVARSLEKEEYLKEIKKLFPECYICNLDGKVIME